MTDFRQIYGLPRRYFLSLGRMVPKKNLATLVAAYARYCQKAEGRDEPLARPDHKQADARVARPYPVSLVFVGSGEEEAALEAQARALGLEVVDRRSWKTGERMADGGDRSETRTKGTGGVDTAAIKTRHSPLVARHEENRGAVFFYGFRQIEENPVFYALAEAFVLPSLYEEWGLVVNEAMACSLPVIVSRTAGCAEDLLPGTLEHMVGLDLRASHVASEMLPARPEAEPYPGKTTGSVDPHAPGTLPAGSNAAGPEVQPYLGKLSPSDLNPLEERSNGFVFDPTSVEALAEAMRRITESGERRAEMGKRSREVVDLFSCDNFARQAISAARAALEI